MASHNESTKKSNENEVATFNAEKLQSNMKVIYYYRTFMSIIGGVIAGICGFTCLMGFVIYVLVMAITSVCLTALAGFSIHSYFDSWNRDLLDGFLDGLLVNVSYLLIKYALVFKYLLLDMCINQPTVSFYVVVRVVLDILLACVNKPRYEGPEVDREMAAKDAKALYKAGEKKLGTDEKVLYKSMQGLGTNDTTLIRVIVTRTEIDMQYIKAEYHKKYTKNLNDAVHSETSGHYRTFLLLLLLE
ncbi:putative rab5-interacting protein family [Helianthus anomalus]